MSHTTGPLETLLRLKAHEYMWDLLPTLLICKFLTDKSRVVVTSSY